MLLADIYRKLGQAIGGRPWSYILRDIWHKYEGLCIIALVTIGAVLGYWLWPFVFWLLLVFALGYVAGHLFWGTKYIPDQQSEENKEQ